MKFVEVSPGVAQVRSGPLPELREGEGRVRVLACGLCGTDVHLFKGMQLPPNATYPVRPGHEVAGILIEARGTTSIELGSLVVLHIFEVCQECDACLSSNEQRCESQRILGIHAPGGMADSVTWPLSRMVAVGDIDPLSAALLPDAAATAHHALRLADPGDGPLCVIGAGGVGSNVLRLSTILYPEAVLVAIVRRPESALALENLAKTVIGLEGSAKQVKKVVGECAAVVDFSGSALAAAEGVRMLKRGGRLILGSVSEEPLDIRMPVVGVVSRELDIMGCYGSTMKDLRTVCSLAESGSFDVGSSVSSVIDLASVPNVLRAHAEGSAAGGRAVIVPDQVSSV
ncbi:MAG: alcohol dehydrogenase catalytic domain-containing protein [Actinobacteria bacterium]|nr:alcohol dehydrogenase catalytic domain-containing protein [Actinomycetota bacterium]